MESRPSSLRRSDRAEKAHASARVGVPRYKRIFIIADSRVHREGLAHLLRSRRLTVVGTSSPQEALAAVRRDEPDIVLLDVQRETGLALVTHLRGSASEVKSVVIGMTEDGPDFVEWAEAGAVGYSTLDDSVDELLAVIASVVHGETLCSPRIAAAIVHRLERLAAFGGPAVLLGSLTSREMEVADLLAAGMSNKEIALSLSIALPTVKTHVHNILAKLKVRRRGEAVARIHSRREGGFA